MTEPVVFNGCEDDSETINLELGNNIVRGNIVGIMDGVTVGIKGTNTRTSTDKNGVFMISGIPAGEYMLYFDIDGQEYTYLVSVPEKSTIMIRNIRILTDGSLSVDYVKNIQFKSQGTTDSIGAFIEFFWGGWFGMDEIIIQDDPYTNSTGDTNLLTGACESVGVHESILDIW